MKKRHCKKYSHFKGETLHLLPAADDFNFGRENAVLCSYNPWPVGCGTRRTRAILSRDRMEDDENFCTALPCMCTIYE